MEELPIFMYEKDGQIVIKLQDLMNFLSHHVEEKERFIEYSGGVGVSGANAEIEFCKMLLKKPERIFIRDNGVITTKEE